MFTKITLENVLCFRKIEWDLEASVLPKRKTSQY